jgi:ABC-type sugar transport system substrate-binding protein
VSTSTCLTAAKKILKTNETSPVFKVGPKLRAKLARGKSIWFINDTLASPTLAIEQSGVVEAAHVAGLNLHTYDANGTVTGVQNGFAEALAAHPAVIAIAAIEASLIEPELSQAKAAGIPVVSMWEPPDVPGTIFATVNSSATQLGQDDAAGGMVYTGCAMHALWLYAPTYGAEVGPLKAGQALIKKLCPTTCSITTLDYDLASPVTVAPKAAEAIAGNPSLNTVVLGTDDLADVVLPALAQSGEHPKVFSSEGLPITINSVRSKGPMGGDTALLGSSKSTGWFVIDEVLRAILKMKPSPYDNIYGRWIDSANIASVMGTNTIPTITNHYQSVLKRDWGLG